MIDFKNPTAYKLAAADPSAYLAMLQPMMILDEEIIQAYKTVRDAIVFTNRRIFAINLQGLTGKKKGHLFPALQQDSGLLGGDCRCAGYRQ